MDESNLSIGRVNQQIDLWAHKHSDLIHIVYFHCFSLDISTI